TGTGGAGGAYAAYCQKWIDYLKTCHPGQQLPTEAQCEQGEPCFRALFRDDVEQPLLDCLENLPCGKDPGGCYGGEVATTTPTPAAQAFQNDCLAKVKACNYS